MRLIWRLLRQHISVSQLAGFVFANLIGLSIILCGVQLYSDLKPALTGEDSLMSNDYIVVSKHVTSDKMLNRDATRFSQEEIDRLAKQPFVKRFGEFRSSQFTVRAAVQMLNAHTMLFFESVPDEFLDIKSDKWHFTPGDKVIPIIIPRAYLNLYNFGFSPSMAVPQLSEEFLADIPIDIIITTGDNSTVRYEAYIVGFSERINTILVPESFLSWANAQYGRNVGYFSNNQGEQGGVSRLIFEADNPSDKAIGEYLEANSYYAEDNGSATSKMNYLLDVALAVIVAIGAIFSVLSLYILTLSIYLLLQKNMTKLGNLVLAGYAPRMVAAPYKLLAVALNVAVVAGAIGVVFLLRGYYLKELSLIFGSTFEGSTSYTLLVGGVIAVVVILFNMLIIQRKVNEISRKR